MSATAILDAPSVKAWPQVKLADVADIVNGGTPKSNVAEFWDGEHQWLTPADMGKMVGREIAQTPRTITAMGLAKSSARLAPPRSVILSTRAPIGHLAINSVPMAFNQGCRALVPGLKLDHVFLYYFLLHSRELLNELGTGTTFKELSATSLKTVQMPLPPLEEQKRIVAVLDQAFAALDRARALAEANLADATSIYRSSLNAYVKETIDQFGSTFLQEFCKHITDGDHSPPPKAASGVPFVTISNIDKQTGELNFDRTFFVPLAYYEALQDSRKPTVGDLLYTVTGATLGVPSLVVTDRKFCFQRHVAIIKPKATTSPEWLLHVLRSQFVFKQATDGSTGAAQKTVSLKALRGLQVPKIDAAAQEAAAAKLAALWQAAEPLRRCYETQLKELGQLRQSLLQRAFAGEMC